MSPEPKIERYEVITPTSATADDYGNIVVKSIAGEVRVNKKHESLHPLFYEASQEGRALKVGFAVYMNKEYIHTAELFDGKPPEEKQVEPITTKAEPLSPNVAPLVKPPSKNASFALSYSKDLAVAGKIEPDKILSYAEVFVRWLDGDITVTDEGVFTALLKRTFHVD